MAVYVGIDMGGTKTVAAAGDKQGTITRRVRHNTPLDLQQGLDLLNNLIAEVSAGEKVAGIGASVGGPLDWRTGVVSPLHQPQWRGVPLKALLEERWDCPVYIDVDTNLGVMGEYHLGEDKPNRFLYVTVSTGMGGGFLVDGQIYRGVDGAHPEIAHQSISYRCSNPAGIQCECGVPDCLEAIVSGNGIFRIYGVPAAELDEDQWDEVAYNGGQGLRNLAAILAPEVIALGGGVAVGGGERLLDGARRVMADHLRIVPAPRLRFSHLGYDTALMGAVVTASRGLG